MSLFDGKTDDMKVRNVYEIDEEKIEELSEVSDYWNKSFEFYTSVKDKPYIDMTERQIDWLDRIHQDHVIQHSKLC